MEKIVYITIKNCLGCPFNYSDLTQTMKDGFIRAKTKPKPYCNHPNGKFYIKKNEDELFPGNCPAETVH